MPDTPVEVPQFCDRHQAKLVHAAGFKPEDPWRALLIIGTLVMFQGASCHRRIWEKVEGDVARVKELGCLACKLPGLFETLARTAKSKDPGAIKELGERWIREAGERKQQEAK